MIEFPNDPNEFYRHLVRTVKEDPGSVRRSLEKIKDRFLKTQEPAEILACLYVFFARLFVEDDQIKKHTSYIIDHFNQLPMADWTDVEDWKSELLISGISYIGIFYANIEDYKQADFMVFRSIHSVIDGENNNCQIKLKALIFFMKIKDLEGNKWTDIDDENFCKEQLTHYNQLYSRTILNWLAG